MSGPVAAIDCGTNSIKLLIGNPPDVVLRDSRVVRLGQDVDRTGRLAEEALARTFEAVEEFVGLIRDHGVPSERIRFCATSASRDAENAQTFVDGVVERLGVAPEVLTGAEEAALVYEGATSFLDPRPDEPVLVVDIGGGSTELVLGEDGPRQSVSSDIGSVRLTERHLHDDPPTTDQVAACVRDIEDHLDEAEVELHRARSVVGTSGTIKTIAAGLLDLASYDRDAIDGSRLATADTHAYVDGLVALSVQRRRALPYMHPGRADVIGAGALIWSRVLARAGVERYLVSEADILHGIAASIR